MSQGSESGLVSVGSVVMPSLVSDMSVCMVVANNMNHGSDAPVCIASDV